MASLCAGEKPDQPELSSRMASSGGNVGPDWGGGLGDGAAVQIGLTAVRRAKLNTVDDA